MKTKLCYRFENGQFPIELKQTGIDCFTVRYGLQVKKNLSYVRAAHELGEVLFHALSCEGIVDNGL